MLFSKVHDNIVAPDEWTRIVTRPDAPAPSNGNGSTQPSVAPTSSGQESHTVLERLAAMRASLDEPHQPEDGGAQSS